MLQPIFHRTWTWKLNTFVGFHVSLWIIFVWFSLSSSWNSIHTSSIQQKHRWSIRTWTTDWLKTGYYKLKLLFSESQISFACNKVFPLCKHVNMVSIVLLLEEELGGCWFSFSFVANLDLRNDNAAQQGVHKTSGDGSAPSPLLNKDVNFSPVLENRPQTPTTGALSSSNYKV